VWKQLPLIQTIEDINTKIQFECDGNEDCQSVISKLENVINELQANGSISEKAIEMINDYNHPDLCSSHEIYQLVHQRTVLEGNVSTVLIEAGDTLRQHNCALWLNKNFVRVLFNILNSVQYETANELSSKLEKLTETSYEVEHKIKLYQSLLCCKMFLMNEDLGTNDQ
jgi:hypothetical protein